MLVVRRFMMAALWMRAGFGFQRRIALGALALLLALMAPQAFAKPCTVNVSAQAFPTKTIYEFNATDNATCDNGLGYGNYWGIADSSGGFANNGAEDTYVTTTQGGRLYIFSGVIPGSSNTGILQSGFIYYPPAGFSGTDTGTFYTQNTAGGPWLNNGVVVFNVPAGATQPTVTSVSPANGTTAGGTLVTITGTNFSGATAVSVGGNSASAITVVNSTTITATTPAGGAGAVDVRVTTPGGTSATNTNAKFTYVAPSPPIAAPSAATVAYGSAGNPITLALTGGTATQINLVTATTHGTVFVTGTSVTYTPNVGYAGPDSFVYSAQNGGGVSSPATVSITVAPPTVTYAPGNPALATAGVAYDRNIAGATGGTAPYTYAITSGALPGGLTLSSNGAITGTPRAVGSFQFQVSATDSSTGIGPFSATTSMLTLNVAAPTLSMSPAPGTLSGYVGASFSQTFTASGGNSPYTYALNVTSGTLPTGLSFNASSGVLSGTPASAGTVSFNVSATDSTTGASFSVVAGYTLTVSAPTVAVNPPTVANPQAGVPYIQNLTASGGTGPYTFTVAAGSMPAGISLNPTTGVLSGTPTVAGTFNVSVQATDANGFTGVRPYTLTVGAPSLTLQPTSLVSGVAGTTFSQTFTTSGGTAPYTYSMTGTLPAGMTLSSAGVLSGTPTATGAFPISITSTEATGGGGPFSVARNYTLTVVAGGVVVAPGSLPAPTLGTAYSQAVTASGGVAPYTYTISAGALPAGLTLSSTGALSGTPTQAGSFNFTVAAVDSATGGSPSIGTRAYTFTIAAPAIVLSSTLSVPTIGSPYSQTVTASGGIGPYTFSLASGTLPTGLALSSAGVLSGTTTATGTFNFTIRATDSSGAAFSGTQSYSMTIGAPFISLTPATLPDPAVGIAYSQTITAAGGIAPYTYTVSAGTLPAGLTLNASTGVLSGTPTAMGASAFTISVRDSSTGTGAPFSTARAFALNTTQTVPTAPPVSATTGSNAPVTINATANAANGPFTGVSIVTPPATGTARVEGLNIIYTPAATSAGVVTFAYALQNSAGASAPVQVSITVTPIPIPVAQRQAATAAGKEVVIDITDGASGGPFTGAAILSVSPSNAGSAVLAAAAPKQTASAQMLGKQPSAAGQTYTVTFAPAAAFAGTAVITYTISNASATSAPAALQISVSPRRDPSTDPDVSGLINAQIQAARRFATAQISNYNQRLERLHANGREAFTNNLTVVMPTAAGNPQQCQDMQSLSARDMCQRGVVTPSSRNNQRGGSGFGAKGLAANNTTTAADGVAATGAGTLLAALPGSPDGIGNGMTGAPDLPGADTTGADNHDARLAVWTAGSVDFGFANVGTQRSGFRFTTGGVTVGADYRVSDQLTVGAGFGYGRDGTDIGASGTHSSADAYSIALYGSYRPTPSYFIDGVAGAGLLRFDSRRWVTDEAAFANGQRDGHQLFASLSAGYEHRSERWLFSPYARMLVAESKLDPFSESGAGLGALTYFGQTVTTVSGALGMRTEFAKETRYGMFLPFARVEYQHDFEGQSAANLAYADLASAGPAYTVYGTPFGRDRIQVGLGAKLRTKTLTFGLDYNVLFGMSGLQQGVRLTFTAPF